MISVICVCNDQEILRESLLKSLGVQDAEHEFIEVENIDGRYSSAASALNAGAREASGDYLVFAHQDVVLGSNDFLTKARALMDSLPDVGIAGVAGRLDHRGVFTNITHGNPPSHAGHIRMERPEIVQSVDECLFIIPRSVFERLRFDERTCDDWHLYAVDYSLSVRKLGLNAYALPLGAHHLSSGQSMSKMYYRTLAKVAKKHKKDYPWLHTALGSWRTGIPIWLQLLSIRTKRRLRRRGGEQHG